MKRILLFSSLFSVMLQSQSLEPRLYTNVPTDVNFFVAGALHSQGALPSNSVLVDPKININVLVLAYARGLNILGHSSKVDVIIPSACIDGTAVFLGDKVSRDVCGLGDIKTRLSFMLLGASATKLKGFSSYSQDVIVGISAQITAPTGQYDTKKLVNVSANRWALKVGTGVSKKIDSFLFELAVDAEYYTPNTQFIGKTRKQGIVYSTQAHFIYTISRGVWFGLDANYYVGGENTEDDVKLNDALNNSRYGATFSFPLSRTNSLKINASSGMLTRAGTNFDTVGIYWQYMFKDN